MPKEQPDNTGIKEGYTAVDGALIAARILRQMPRAQRTKIIEVMRERDQALATAVQERMYNFQELSRLSSKSAQLLVREVEHRDLVISMKAAPEQIKEHLLENMSQRKRELVIDDAAHTPDPETHHLKEAQWRILEKLEELKERGVLPKGKVQVA